MLSFQNFGIVAFQLLLISILAFFIALKLLYYYKQTSVIDYFLISITFFLGSTTVFFRFIGIVFPDSLNELIIQQIIHSLLNTINFVFFIYAVRVKWMKPPKIILYFGIICYLILQLVIFSFELMYLPEQSFVIFTKMQSTEEPGLGAGYILEDGTLILGTGYNFLLMSYEVFVFSLILYIYVTTPFVVDTDRVRKIQKLWITAISLYLLRGLITLVYQLSSSDFVDFYSMYSVFLLSSVALVAYIAITHSEAVLLSHIQLFRASKLYLKIVEMKSEGELIEFGMSSVVDYMKNIPPDLKKQLMSKRN
jgi:hypothetical protein